MTENVFELCDNRVCKVLFRDGGTVRSIKGEILPGTDDFLRLHTLTQDFLINRREVLKIQVPSESDCNGRGVNTVRQA